MTVKTLSSRQSHSQTLATATGVQLPSPGEPTFLPPAPPDIISGAYDSTVTPSGGYLNLTVTSTGSVNPGAGITVGADGVRGGYYNPVYVLNQGSITGGSAGSGVYGGYGGGEGVFLFAGGSINNAGTISGGAGGNTSLPRSGFAAYGGGFGGAGVLLDSYGSYTRLTNSGTIEGGNGGYGPTLGGVGGRGVGAYGTVSITNSGLIEGGQCGTAPANAHSAGGGGTGLFLQSYYRPVTPTAFGTNSGTILGGNAGPVARYAAPGGTGVVLSSASLGNTGLIQGGAGNANSPGGIGVRMAYSTLSNAGTISGGTGYGGTQVADAVMLYGSADNTLIVDPGAVFDGQVAVVGNDGHAEILDLGGTTGGTLTGIGTQFTGFTNLGFEAGAQWSIEGTYTALAGGQEITGFASGDSMTLDGFVETSETYVAGTGVELSNGSTSITLALTGNYSGDTFQVTTANGDTTVALPGGGGPVSTISTAVYTQVSLASAAYAATLTVTGSGSVAPGGYGTAAIYATAPGVSLLSSGAITGSGGSYFYANGFGHGGTAGSGVLLTGGGTVVNYGNITGGNGRFASYGGAGGTGIDLGGGMLTNNGNITGGNGGGGYFTGGGGDGALLNGVTLLNTGTITGGVGGAGVFSSQGGAGVVLVGGAALNTGSIEGGSGGYGYAQGGTGVLLDGGVFTNAGTISGGPGVQGYYGRGANGPAMVVYGNTGSTLVVDSGAVFNGDVNVYGGTAALEFGGAAQGVLTGIGTQFNGFTSFGFEAGAEWSVEGTYTALAGGQAITGFTAGDSITLDGFSATSETYVAGTGVELGNGSTTVTLALTGNYTGETFQISTYGADTTIDLPPFGQVSTITNAVTTSVTLASNAYAGRLTVNGAGSVAPSAYCAAGVTGNTAGVSLLNLGQITGGAGSFALNYGPGGGDGVVLHQPGAVTNYGSISGGAGAFAGAQGYGGSGGEGVVLAAGGTLTNGGSITGGAAGYGYYDGVGGAGVVVAGGVLTNGGTIAGGSAYGNGSGIGGGGLDGGGSIFNTGVIDGGSGGQGGTGVRMHYGELTNTGNIAGGNGGAGGSGVQLSSGTLINEGVISGGAGSGNGGGAGVFITGGTLVNAGTISGGTRLDGAAVSAVAIQGNQGAVLVIDPGARFNGSVAVYSGTAALELGGTAAGTLSGLGTQFTGFDPVTVDAGSNWTLAGKDTLGGGTILTVDGHLNINGKLEETRTTTVTQNGELRAGGNGVVLLGTLTLAGGTLAEGADAQIVVGSRVSGTSAGALTVTKGYSLSGYGVIGGGGSNMIADNGTVTAGGGTLTLVTRIAGSGTLTIGSGAALVADRAVTVADVSFAGAGSLTLADPTATTSTIGGFSTGDTIDLEHLKVKSVSFSNDTLTLLGKAHAVLGTLLFTGDYTAANFGLSSVAGGTDLTFTTPSAADFAPSLGAEAGMPSSPMLLETGWHAQNPLGAMPDLLMLHHFGV